MGYDYYWINEPSEELLAPYDKARDAVDLAVRKRNALDPAVHPRGSAVWEAAQDEVMAAADVLDDERVWYFRLNLSGGGRYASAMAALGMVDDAPPPDWPDAADHPALAALPVAVWELLDLIATYPRVIEALPDDAVRRFNALIGTADSNTAREHDALREQPRTIMDSLVAEGSAPAMNDGEAPDRGAEPARESGLTYSEQLRRELFTAITGAQLPDYWASEWAYLIEHPDVIPAALAYRAEHDKVLRWPNSSDYMWFHKIAGTNDGWINTPEEIAAALQTYRSADATTVTEVLDEHGVERDYWDKWIAFLDRAATDGGGFKTN